VITVVTYLWAHRGRTPTYRPAHVQLLARSVARWLSVPHRVVCISDEPVKGVETHQNPAPQFPARCYRRLWLFSPEARTLGDQILHLDLDLVICGPLDALVQRAADLVVYKAPSIARRGYSLNPSVMTLRPGTQTDIWERFCQDPAKIIRLAEADGWWGSDQAVLSYLRRTTPVETVGDADGVVSFRRIRHERLTTLPPNTRIVSFHGKRTPWEPEIQTQHPWIRSAWEEAA